MRKLLLKILIVICVIVGFGSLSQIFHSEKDPSGSSGSSSSSSSSGELVTGIELSDEELIF